MPRFVAWVQDNLLLTLLIIASGFVNGVMMIDGWVANVQDPASWGIWGTFGVVILFAAGLGMGGLSVRISYKLSECYANRQWGRVAFMALGMAVFAFVEFWASFSQRAAHIHLTPADSALLGVFNIHNPAVSLTAILISIVVPFASVFWGFAAEDPAPKEVEDAATLAQRLANEQAILQHKQKMNAIKAKGMRATIRAGMGKEDEPEAPANAAAIDGESSDNTGDNDDAIAGDDPNLHPDWLPANRWRWQELQAWVREELRRDISEDQAKDIIKTTPHAEKAPHVGSPMIASIGWAKQRAKTVLKVRKVTAIDKRNVERKAPASGGESTG